MALKGDKSSTTKNHMFWVIRPACMANMTSPREVVEAPLNLYSIRPGFSKANDRSPICLYANICKRSAELPRSIKTLLTSNPLIPSVRIRASSCGWRTRLGFIGEKVIISSTGRAPHPTSYVGWS